MTGRQVMGITGEGVTRARRILISLPAPFALGLLVVVAVLPLCQPGLPNVGDAPIHLFRTAEWVRSWQAGILFPRWAPYLAYGYGYPLFVFAPPLPYALAGLLHLIGFSLTAAIKLLVVACFIVAGTGTYALAREHLGSLPALLAAAAFLLAPFLLREAYLYGGNYPQLMAIALYPAVLWAFHRLIATRRIAYLLLAAGLYGALLLSHNFHALIFTPLLCLYVLLLAWWDPASGLQGRDVAWRRLRQAGLALLLGLGLTACFWLPAFFERQWTRAQAAYYVAVSPFSLRFLELRDLIAPPASMDASAANPALPFTLGTVIVALAAIGTGAICARARKYGTALFFVLVLLLVTLMMLPESKWLWDHVPLLAVAEFPWRLMGIAALCCAVLAGAALVLLPAGRWVRIGCTVAVVAVLLGSAVYLYPPKPFVTYGSSGTPTLSDQAQYEQYTGTIGSTTLGEFLPVWVKQAPNTSPLVPDMLGGRPVEKLDRSALPAGVEATLLRQTPNLDRYQFTSSQPFTARFLTFYFPGWRAFVDGRPTQVSASDPEGLIEVPVPAGRHEIALHFGETSLRLIADGISLLSLAVALTLLVIGVRGRGRGSAKTTGPSQARGPAGFMLPAVLLIVLLAKEVLVDPHTTWFRRQSPPGEVIGMTHPVQATINDQVRLLGYSLDHEVVRQGGRVHLTLYWQALTPLAQNLSTFVHLDAPPYATTLMAADNSPPGDPRAQTDAPTTRWELGDYIRDEHRFVVDASLPPVRYTLTVGLYDPATQVRVGETIPLQPIQVLPAHPVRLGQVPNRTQYRLGESIELLGYSLDAGPQPTLTLYWRTDRRLEEDYSVFVHIMGPMGQRLEQRDGPPLGGMYPTTAWWPGQVIVDRREMPSLPAGGQVLVGLYDLASMQRLPAYDAGGQRLADDAIPLPIAP